MSKQKAAAKNATFICINCKRERPDLRARRTKISDPLRSDCAQAMYGVSPHHPATCGAKAMFGRDCKRCTLWRELNPSAQETTNDN